MRMYGSVRGAASDGRPYRDSNPPERVVGIESKAEAVTKSES